MGSKGQVNDDATVWLTCSSIVRCDIYTVRISRDYVLETLFSQCSRIGDGYANSIPGPGHRYTAICQTILLHCRRCWFYFLSSAYIYRNLSDDFASLLSEGLVDRLGLVCTYI